MLMNEKFHIQIQIYVKCIPKCVQQQTINWTSDNQNTTRTMAILCTQYVLWQAKSVND